MHKLLISLTLLTFNLLAEINVCESDDEKITYMSHYEISKGQDESFSIKHRLRVLNGSYSHIRIAYNSETFGKTREVKIDSKPVLLKTFLNAIAKESKCNVIYTNKIIILTNETLKYEEVFTDSFNDPSNKKLIEKIKNLKFKSFMVSSIEYDEVIKILNKKKVKIKFISRKKDSYRFGPSLTTPTLNDYSLYDLLVITALSSGSKLSIKNNEIILSQQ